jgi:beta-glucanase (GH16 family)
MTSTWDAPAFEARMTGAPGAGTWPAFWLLDTESATRRSTTSGEVDAVELYGHNPTGSCHALHTWDNGVDQADVVTCLEDNGFSDWAMTWHTYGVRIVPDGAVYYIDGVQVATATGLRQHSEPFYFMVNLALGGGWPVDLSPTGEVSDLYIDWIRVWT